jgi:hypothetical protein
LLLMPECRWPVGCGCVDTESASSQSIHHPKL